MLRSLWNWTEESLVQFPRFGDGTVVGIEGCGSVLFVAHNGEHRLPTDVYFIPKLSSNIISLGQLDEFICKYSVDQGVMRTKRK